MGMVASANAGTFEMNMYGASAQFKFWNNLADDFLRDTSANGGQCGTVVGPAQYDEENGVSMGTGCRDLDGDGSDDTIIIRYSSEASYWGVAKINGCGTDDALADMADENTCDWTAGTCTGTKSVAVNMGASDVDHDKFTGTTSGYEKGNKSYDGTDNPYTVGPFDGLVPASKLGDTVEEFNPVIVPFGFIVSDSVCTFRCVSPGPWTGDHTTAGSDGDNLTNTGGPTTIAAYEALGTVGDEHKAYSHFGWGCDPADSDASGHNAACQGQYKCANNVCTGGDNVGGQCDDASQCPDVAIEETRCEAVPLDNINHTMAGQIFSGNVDDWSDFGPYFCEGPIQVMMRHEGSGTHATVKDLLQPYSLATATTLYTNQFPGFTVNNVIHYESSSDVTKAVCDFPGAIGYVDADKMLFYDDLNDGKMNGSWASPFGADNDAADGYVGCHLAKYDGVEPTRAKIINGEYEFWADQHVYYCVDDWDDAGYDTLLSAISAFSSDGDNLTFTDYWVAQDDMKVTKDRKVLNKKDRIVRK